MLRGDFPGHKVVEYLVFKTLPHFFPALNVLSFSIRAASLLAFRCCHSYFYFYCSHSWQMWCHLIGFQFVLIMLNNCSCAYLPSAYLFHWNVTIFFVSCTVSNCTVFCWLLRSLYFGYLTFITYVICKYFLSVACHFMFNGEGLLQNKTNCFILKKKQIY